MPNDPRRRSRWDNNRPEQSVIPEALYHKRNTQRREALKCFAYERFLDAKWLGALLGTSTRVALRTLEDLSALPHAYLKICDYQRENKADFMWSMRQFELTQFGIDTVYEHFGIKPIPPNSPSQIKHQIMGDQAMASFRIGAKATVGRVIIMPFQELLAHPKTPEKTKRTARPNTIPLGGTIPGSKGKQVPHIIRTDREAFVIRDTQEGRIYPIAGIECGRGTETHEPEDKSHTTDSHSTTYGKFADIITAFDKEIVEDLFDWPTCYFIFLEPIPQRIENMAKLWEKMTMRHNEFRPRILFKVWHSYAETYEASGRMLTGPFHIIGEDGKPTSFSLVQ